MDLQFLHRILDTINKEFQSVLINNARIRTGFLKSSIDSKTLFTDNEKGVSVILAHYGRFNRPWRDEKNPQSKLIELITNKYSKELGEAFAKDLKVQITRNI
jgi:hypothetical protein